MEYQIQIIIVTIAMSNQYIDYLYNLILPVIGIGIIVDLKPICSLVIVLLLWSTLFAFYKYIIYSSQPSIHHSIAKELSEKLSALKVHIIRIFAIY